MESFQHSYYALNRRLLLLIGQWPYQNQTDRLCRMAIILFLLGTLTASQIALLISDTTFQTMIIIVPPMSAILGIVTKMSSLYVYRNNIKQFVELMIENWKLWKSKEELNIMHKFGREGKMITFFYTVYIYTSMTMFLLMPFVPRVMDQIAPLNESRRLTHIFTCEYFVDQDEYFLSIYFHMVVVIVAGITVLISSDVFFLLLNSHICGVFTAVGFRLEHFVEGPTQSRKACLKNIICAIKIHKRALDFAELIESVYSIPMCIEVALSLTCMTVSLFQILITLDKPSEAVRFGFFAGAQLVHLFCLCYPGQRMIDYSTQIQLNAYSGLWYEAPIEVHTLVLLIMRRSLEPCYITAGKIFILCLETFSSVVQTATSYFMVIAGTQ